MLRSIFVISLVGVGAWYALQGPFYALLFYIGNAYFRPEDWVWWDFVSQLKLSFIAGAYVVLASLFSGQRFVLNGKILLLGLLLFHTFLSTMLSEHFTYSWSYWTDFLKIITITYLIVVLVDDLAKFRLTLLIMALALGLEGAKQGWLHLVTSPTWPNANEIPFLGDNNGVAVGMFMLVPAFAMLGQTAQRSWARYFYWLLLVGVLLRGLTTHSRGGFLACLALGIAYWWRSPRKVRSGLGILVLAVITLYALPDTYWNRMQTITTYEETEDRSALGRLHYWAVAIEMARAKPLFGVGYNAYNLSYDTYDFSHGEYGQARSVHNSFLGVLAELGFVGATLYALVLFSAFLTCWRLRRLARVGQVPLTVEQNALALESGLFAFAVGGSFVIFQYNEMLFHYIGLTIALECIARRALREKADGQRHSASSADVRGNLIQSHAR